MRNNMREDMVIMKKEIAETKSIAYEKMSTEYKVEIDCIDWRNEIVKEIREINRRI